MKNLLVAIVSEGLFSLVALLVISAIVWFGGDYLGYSTQLRILVIVTILALWLVLYLVQRILAVRRAMRIEAMLRAQASASGTVVVGGDPIAAMVHQFRLGVRALDDTRPGRAAVRTMPWFLVMGPPGSGKSTAVRESGLNFPSVGLGHRANASVAATRSLEWWYAERAVFLDTAGAYVSDPGRHKEWLALIRQLGGTGRTTPVDGVVLVVSIASLLALEDDRINDHAQALRDRLDELAARLGLVFPVYLMFSHCDRLHGFVDFFSHFPLEERGQVWGCTFDWNASSPQGLQAQVEEEFQRLYQVLDQRRIEALAATNSASGAGDVASDHQRNALLFPIQFALLQRRVGHYISALSRPNPFQESGRLRGFYFTSAAQGGVPIDRVMASIGLSEDTLPSVQVAEQRPYFLNGPFAQVIPADQGLARSSTRALNRHRLVSSTLALLALGAATAGGFYLYHGYKQTRDVLDRLVVAGQRLRSVEPTSRESVAVADDLFVQLERFESRANIPVVLQPFLLPGRDLPKQVRSAYLARFARPLVATYARNLGVELTAKLASDQRTLANSETIEQTYRVYLMLCGRIALQRDAVQRLLASKGVANSGNAKVAEAHLAHVIAHFSAPEWTATADPALIERTNRELRDALWIPLTGIEIARTGSNLFPAVDLATLLPKQRTDGFILERPLSGIFTQAAWDGLVASSIEERASTLTRRLAELQIDMDASAVAKRLRSQFVNEHRRQWNTLIGGVRVDMPQTLDAVIARLGELSNAGSPYRELVQAWMHQQVLRTTSVEEAAAVVTVTDEERLKAEAKRNEWLERALLAVNNLQVCLSHYVSACPVGSRFANEAELDKAVAGFSAYTLAIDAALAAYRDDESRPALMAHFRDMVAATRLAFERDVMLDVPLVATGGLVVAVDRAELALRLQGATLESFPQRWRDLLAVVSVPPTTNAAAASTRLITQSAANSPLLQTLRAAWRGQQVVGIQGATQVNDDWIERCGKALANLSAAYAPAIDGEPSMRIARSEELKRLAEAFVNTERDITAALDGISDVTFRATAARPLAQLRLDAQRQLFALLAADAEHYWGEQVRGRFIRDLASTFPFAVAGSDCEVDTVSAFLAPKAGAVWQAERVLNAVADITIAGRPLITLSDGYRQALTVAKAARDALFPVGNEAPALAFTAEMRQRSGVYQAQVAIGTQALDLHDNPEGRRAFTSTLAEPVACRVAIQVEDGKWIEAVSPRRPWGLLHWASGAAPVVEGAGRVVLTWNLAAAAAAPEAEVAAASSETSPVVAKSWLIQLVVDDGPAVALFSRRIFDALVFPATIAVWSPEEQ